jgi:GST-like protein
MLELYTAATPNGQKLRLFFEETGLPHRVNIVRLSQGEQHRPEFVAISPNHKIPALVDHGAEGGPLKLFESGAILWYLAEKYRRFLPSDPQGRMDVLTWLFWQVSGLGPIAGQAGHFLVFAPEPVPYAIDRYTRELARLYGVLDARLRGREFIAGEYSIADMACYPWIVSHAGHGQRLADFPDLARWFAAVAARPATQRAYVGVDDPYAQGRAPLSEQARLALFGAPTTPR